MKLGLMKPCKNSFPLGCPGRKEIALCHFRGPQSFQHLFTSPKAGTSLLPATIPALWMDSSVPFFSFGYVMCPHMMFRSHVLGVLLLFFCKVLFSPQTKQIRNHLTCFPQKDFHHKSFTNLHSLEVQIIFTKLFC